METLRTRVWKSTGVKIALVLPFLVLFILGACKPTNEPPGYETWTPSPSVTPTCEPNIRLSTPEGWGLTKRLFVILYDPRFNGDQYLELANGETTQDIPLFISRIVPTLMKPSDQVAVFYMGYSSYNDARVARLYSYTTPPPLYNTPAPPPTLPPLPPTTIPTPGFSLVATKEAVRIQSTAMANTEMVNGAIYNCQKNYWNNIAQVTATAWNSTATAEINSISNELNTALKNANNNSKGKPFATDELYYGGVYYGLNFATTVFQSDCKNYDACILLIINDMHVLRRNNPDKLSINLDGVKTYAIMPECQDIDQPNCKILEDYWDSEFPKFGAAQPVYLNGIHAETNLLNDIER